MAFIQRILTAIITLGEGKVFNFSFNGSNSVSLTGYRMSAHIIKSGGASQGELQLAIYGLNLSIMNQLSTLGRTPVIIGVGAGANTITLMAGDANGLSVAFTGNISQAYTDLSGAPDAIFNISAFAGLGQALQTINPSSYPGPVDVAVVMSGLATQMGLIFENNGVSVILPAGSYFSGSARTQAEDAANTAHIEWVIENGKLAIWPKNGSRGGLIPIISKDNGLIGYPYPSGQGLVGLKCLYSPTILFGSRIQIVSDIEPASGIWTICGVEAELECQVPNGKWESHLTGTPPGYLTVQPK